MKIVLDPQAFNLQRYGGISRYYTEIFSIIAKNRKHEIIIPLNNSNNVYFNNSNLNLYHQIIYSYLIKRLKKIRLDHRLKLYNIAKKRLIKILRKQEYDLFVATYYDISFLQYIGNKPFVLTVYDMIHELFPEYFYVNNITVRNKLILMEKAESIIAVSENTKKDILKIYPQIDESKIEVVYHGSSIQVKESIKATLPENYILFVGERAIYKNFIFLTDAISKLLHSEAELYLLCAGGGKFTASETEFISKLGLENKVIQMSFNDDELGFFYKHAKCFVFPSRYEGFGIPVLESMVCECPVVLANHSSFPEVAGNAGIYFELDNPEDLVMKITNLIHNENLRNDYINKGIEQAKKFNWEIAASQCLKVYEKAFKKYEVILDQTANKN